MWLLVPVEQMFSLFMEFDRGNSPTHHYPPPAEIWLAASRQSNEVRLRMGNNRSDRVRE